MLKQYIYDGSFEGLLTAIFYAYPLKEHAIITRTSHYMPNLLYEPIHLEIEDDKFNRVYTSIQTKLSASILKTVYYLYLHEGVDVENLILKYLRLCYTYGASINLAKNNDIIIEVDLFTRKVTLEAHRFTGFVRFNEIAPLHFYAQIEPDHNILPLLDEHFTRRFSDQHFVIHDFKRKAALIYNQKESVLRLLTDSENISLSRYEAPDAFAQLFKSFYESVTIAERLNPKLQKRGLPTRYWKHLVETQ